MTFRFGDGRDWFFEKRFGLFIHWGIYSIAGWHEQDQYIRNIPREEYARQRDVFNPVKFDPDTWLDIAQAAGMEYICITTKHIDGFCMWATAQTDYSIAHSPYGKDIIGMLADACHRRNFPLCLYYSMDDLHHPNYPHAGRSYELPESLPGDTPDLTRYLEYVKAQITELCTNYGEIHGFWWDANVLEVHDPSFNALIHTLQPSAVINNRGCDDGDFTTPERDWDDAAKSAHAFERPTEACQSVGTESWSYRMDEDYYSDAHLIRSIDKIMAKGGNYLLNVGPKPDGTFPDESLRILRVIGRWYQSVRESFGDAEPAPEVTDNRSIHLTRRGTTVYVHVTDEPAATSVLLPPITTLPQRATLLNTGQPVQVSIDLLPHQCSTGIPHLRLRNLPVNELPGTALIIKLEFDHVLV